MNNKEFEKFIIETATKYLGSDSDSKKPDTIKEQAGEAVEVSAEQVKLLAEEMKKINKKIDLRNPLISPEFFDKVKQESICESKKEEKPLVTEQEKARWQNIYNYSIPKDELR